MLTFPNAKINLGLHITEKRSDDFHNIETIFYPIQWRDALEAVPATSYDFQLITPHDDKKELQNNNLCEQAYQLFENYHKRVPLHISLMKNIPVGAGLGGGSADAAFMLQLCKRFSEATVTSERLQEYALQLGSDCPFFLHNVPMYAQGRGEQLQKIGLDLSDYQIAVAAPAVTVNTGWAYRQITPEPAAEALHQIIQQPVREWKGKLTNDFQPIIFDKYPEIANLHERLYQAGAIYASLSGSGSSVFALFNKKQDLSELREQLELPGHRFFIQNSLPLWS